MPDDKVKVSCANCGTTNYFPLGAQGKKVVCGRCKAELPPPGTILEPPAQQAYAIFKNSSLPVLVDFYSLTCQPCLAMDPVVERLAKRRAGELAVVRVNVETHPELARGFGVQAVPTFVIVHKGIERDRISGGMAEETFAFWVAGRT
jgi:thioredoxin 2